MPFKGQNCERDLTTLQVLDALLKEICAALLESDVNVKLVSSLRQKVKAKAHQQFESSDKLKDANRRNVVQKVNCEIASSQADDSICFLDHF